MKTKTPPITTSTKTTEIVTEDGKTFEVTTRTTVEKRELTDEQIAKRLEKSLQQVDELKAVQEQMSKENESASL